MTGVAVLGWAFNFAYQFADMMAFLLLSALGLIIILGVLNVINLAHGEMIMIGAYVTSALYRSGVPLPLCFLASFATLFLVGLAFERLIIQRFWQNRIGALVATWGVSLMISQAVLILLGPAMAPVPLPAWRFSWGGFTYSGYRLLLFAMSLLAVMGLWLCLYRTRWGVHTRATIQDASTAAGVGINTSRIGMIAFALGAGLAGLTGALYAPTQSLTPLMGTSFIAMAFITVVVGGGANPIIGALGSSALLALVSTPLTMLWGQFIGRAGLLLSALVIIRFMPQGISGFVLERQRFLQHRTSQSVQ
jgi:branched-subunit amino acid ABC-type transport system permease component